ncbi:mechanosensitive ion channel family protein [Okeania sp. SIO2B3]|uniref:mechanosensitive ion channel family protein n=1 Tax=Okeania sp. SIO2B3 TaxID=2607784 RepID=UPI0013C13790|nr:mechanosensitive ion channel family protein [Okeania sp. SIO2B3]NET41382.1 mechanosensitive ion channel family protein [Okeania sp. SIO2B3]
MQISSIKKRENNLQVIYQNVQILITICSLLLCLAVAGFNGWLIYQGQDLIEYKRSIIQNLSSDYWREVGIGVIKSLSLLIITIWIIRYINKCLNWLKEQAENFEKLTANEESIESFFEFFKGNFNNIIWLFYVTLSAQFVQLPAVTIQYLYISLRIYIIITVGLLFIKASTAIIDTFDALSNKYSDRQNILRIYDRLSRLIPLAKRCIEYAIYIITATLVVQQVAFIAKLAIYGPIFIQIIGIIFISRVIEEIAKLILERLLLRNDDSSNLSQQRNQTFLPLFKSVLKYFIYFGTGIAILDTIGMYLGLIFVQILPAGVVILGLAVGMGAKSLIEDLVAGFFILFENYYLVGDFVEINGTYGFVTGIELRTTRINYEDKHYIIHNRDVKDVVNHSHHSNSVVTLKIPYQSDINQIYEIIEKVGKKLQENYPEEIMKRTVVDGIEEFYDYQMLIHITTEVKPGRHIDMKRILGTMIKQAFQEEKIEIPVIHHLMMNNQDRTNINLNK